MNRRAVLAVSACLLVAACGDDPDLSDTSSGSRATPSAAAGAPSPSAAVEPDVPAEVPAFDADTSRDEQASSGGPLSVVAVRVARQDGFDRVVFELDGREPGQPGWRVEYDDDPRADGSGDAVAVDGAETLAILIDGVGYPFDTGVEKEAAQPSVPPELEVVEDVVLGSVFEGVYQAWVGTSRRAAFRVFRLADPARVVVDVRHD